MISFDHRLVGSCCTLVKCTHNWCASNANAEDPPARDMLWKHCTARLYIPGVESTRGSKSKFMAA